MKRNLGLIALSILALSTGVRAQDMGSDQLMSDAEIAASCEGLKVNQTDQIKNIDQLILMEISKTMPLKSINPIIADYHSSIESIESKMSKKLSLEIKEKLQEIQSRATKESGIDQIKDWGTPGATEIIHTHNHLVSKYQSEDPVVAPIQSEFCRKLQVSGHATNCIIYTLNKSNFSGSVESNSSDVLTGGIEVKFDGQGYLDLWRTFSHNNGLAIITSTNYKTEDFNAFGTGGNRSGDGYPILIPDSKVYTIPAVKELLAEKTGILMSVLKNTPEVCLSLDQAKKPEDQLYAKIEKTLAAKSKVQPVPVTNKN